jgi:eukaryotic-like serine/threonine-protein kinase
MNPAQPGDLLAGRYRLRDVIGRGGMGIVWRATDQYLDRDVAIKEAVRTPGLDDREWEAARTRSLREARTAARLNHESIVGVYDVIEQDDRPWIVLQLVPFPSLADVIRDNGPLPPADAAYVGLQIVSALRAAHSADVMHRDVKPSNVLLGPDGRVVLTDFGLAVIDTGAGMTVTGQIVGSPAYMAPERAHGERATPAADLWSLGATLYAAVEGRAAFERGSAMAVLTAVVTEDPDPPVRAGLLWPVISGLMRKDPWARLDAGQAEVMLREVSRGVAPDTTKPYGATDVAMAPLDPPSLLRQGQSTRRPWAGWLMSASLLLIAVATVTLVGLLNSGHSTRPSANTPPGPAGSTFRPRTKLPATSAPSPKASAGNKAGRLAPSVPPGHAKHHHHGRGGHDKGDDGGNDQ